MRGTRATVVGLAALLAVSLTGCGRPASELGPQQPRATSVGTMPPTAFMSRRAKVPLPFYALQPQVETPYSNSDLLRNFMSIALRAEAADDFAADGSITISKWQETVRYRIAGERPQDRVQIEALSQHLSDLTGLDIRQAYDAERHNMDIRFVPRRYRAVSVGELLTTDWLGPKVAGLARDWRDFETERCITLTTRDPRSGITGTAHIFIKDELPPVWRETCIIEEMTQSLGLLNDDPRAAPSIFNDDGIYQSLTSHDELLLRILYDPRIRSGMTRRSVLPLAERVIAELRPAGVRPQGGR